MSSVNTISEHENQVNSRLGQLGQDPDRLRVLEDVLHETNGLFSSSDELVLSCLNFLPVLVELGSVACDLCRLESLLPGVEVQARFLDRQACPGKIKWSVIRAYV